MGIDACGARFLLSAKRHGVSFRRTATLGRQMTLVEAPKFQALLSEFGLFPDAELGAQLNATCDGGYAEPFLRALGAEEIVSIDASPYESCTFIHDMNWPIPRELRSRFDVVIDGGTLEHIFNFPVAIKNCIDMTTVGGHFLSATAGNNFAGHGFYQFSPELFYRVFSRDNGFIPERVMVSEAHVDKRWYRVPDPQNVKSRVEFLSACPTYLLVQAKKVEQMDSISSFPQQSDYVTLWAGRPAASAAGDRKAVRERGWLHEQIASIARRIPGLRRFVADRRRHRARTILVDKLLNGPHGEFLEECEKS